MLKADATELGSDLAKAASKIQGFAQSIVDRPLGIAHGVLSSIPIIGGALAALPISGAGFMSWLKEGRDRILEMGKSADRLGISIKDMGALHIWAGAAAEGLEHNLGHLLRELGQVRLGSDEAANKLRKFGFDANALAEMPLLDALATIADRVKSLKSPVDQAAVAFGLMGKSGLEMLPMLRLGAEGLERAQAQAKRLGLAISPEELAGVREAAKSMREIQRTIDGLQMKLAAGLAPLVKFIADKFLDWLEGLGGVEHMADAIVDAIFKVAEVLLDVFAAVADNVDDLAEHLKLLDVKGLLKEGWREWKADVTGDFDEIDRIIAERNQKKASPFESWGEQLEALRQRMKQGLADTRAGGGGDFGSPLDERLQEMAEKLSEQIAGFGKSAAAAEAWRLKMKGADDGLVQFVLGLDQQLTLMNKYKNIVEDTEPPLSKFTRILGDLSAMFAEGMIDVETYNRSILNLVANFDKFSHAQTKFTPAIDVNTSEGAKKAYSNILQATFGTRDESAAQRVERVRMAMLDEQRRTTAAAKDTAAAVKGLVPVQPAGFFGGLGGS
jgi:hypothetical protein